jgi:hypothetical protein
VSKDPQNSRTASDYSPPSVVATAVSAARFLKRQIFAALIPAGEADSDFPTRLDNAAVALTPTRG